MTEPRSSDALSQPSYIFPDWPAPPRVRSMTTTRVGGVSQAPFDSFNLGTHVGDDALAVLANREQLARDLALPAEPAWLAQVHGKQVVVAERFSRPVEADAALAREPGQVCVVMTADCLPVLLCDRDGTRVGVAHCGWRGLVQGIIGASVAGLGCEPETLIAWLGPAIGPETFEVGIDVRAAFLELDPANADCFCPSFQGRWLADIYVLATRQLQALGIAAVFGGGWCTFTERERFFSYRRDGRTGRMASLIWLAE